MTYQPAVISDDLHTLPKLPAWVTLGRAETLETVAFRSGAVLAVLDALVSDLSQGVRVKLLANRLALKAATCLSKLEGRLARETDIRDAFHLAPPGEARGPDGDLLAYWREAVRLRLPEPGGFPALEGFLGPDRDAEIAHWLGTGIVQVARHGPLAGGVAVMQAVLKADDRAERFACLLLDVVLAQAIGWRHPLPIAALRLSKTMLRDLASDEPGADLTVQRHVLAGLEETVGLARDLARRQAALLAVAPKLRAKGSTAAVALFQSEDAVVPASMLSPMIRGTAIAMTDRAARRFCDRLVALGVARELTGRATFRMYGIAS